MEFHGKMMSNDFQTPVKKEPLPRRRSESEVALHRSQAGGAHLRALGGEGAEAQSEGDRTAQGREEDREEGTSIDYETFFFARHGLRNTKALT